MLFYYVRHGDPVYSPDSLTPLGEKQAQAVAKRLAVYGVDAIYASTSNRAKQTAQPTCDLLKKPMEQLDFANEGYAWQEFTVPKNENSLQWLFQDKKMVNLMASKEVRDLGDAWYEHPAFAGGPYKAGVERIYKEADAFFATLGYDHIPHTGKYKVLRSNDQRIALFAHQGFGIALLSCLLDIPYPAYCTHFDIGHTGLTVIDFQEADGYAVPKVLMHSSDGHLYREGLPTCYNNEIWF